MSSRGSKKWCGRQHNCLYGLVTHLQFLDTVMCRKTIQLSYSPNQEFSRMFVLLCAGCRHRDQCYFLCGPCSFFLSLPSLDKRIFIPEVAMETERIKRERESFHCALTWFLLRIGFIVHFWLFFCCRDWRLGQQWTRSEDHLSLSHTDEHPGGWASARRDERKDRRQQQTNY